MLGNVGLCNGQYVAKALSFVYNVGLLGIGQGVQGICWHGGEATIFVVVVEEQDLFAVAAVAVVED